MARIDGEFYHARGVAAALRHRMLAAQKDPYGGIAWLCGGE